MKPGSKKRFLPHFSDNSDFHFSTEIPVSHHSLHPDHNPEGRTDGKKGGTKQKDIKDKWTWKVEQLDPKTGTHSVITKI